MKNTFRKLRQEKTGIQRKLNIANKTVAMQVEVQKELNNDADTKDRIINILANESEYLKEELSRLQRKQKIFYRRWIVETKRVAYWKAIVVVAGISNVMMAAIVIIGCN